MKKKSVILLLAVLFPFLGTAAKKKVPTEKDMRAYLMVYFTDPTHSLFMALSPDGYTFTSLNDGKPVMDGDTLAQQRGIRDPHIFRGPDGAFYLAMTDLHIFAQRDGKRDTEWERDGAAFGWGNNRALVLMKSFDLINWSRTVFRVDEAFPQEWSDVGCIWAPETTYDYETGKLMLYFTMRHGNGRNKVYYSYVNDEYNKLESAPQVIFEYPKDCNYIDADITYVNGKYHMFYVAHDGGAGIKQAVSDQINKGYVYDPAWYDPEERACEAPNVWKRIGEDKWVLMYDVYGINPHNFGFSETTDFVNFTNLGRFNEGVMKTANFVSPKHGAVIHLTAKEANNLAKKWGLKMKF